jgi:hypothetical protein
VVGNERVSKPSGSVTARRLNISINLKQPFGQVHPVRITKELESDLAAGTLLQNDLKAIDVHAGQAAADVFFRLLDQCLFERVRIESNFNDWH